MAKRGGDGEYVRSLVVEVSRLSDDKQEHWRLFREIEALMVQVQEIQNAFFDRWRAWHFENKTAEKLLAFHAAWKKYLDAKKPKDERPSLGVKAVPDEFLREFRVYVKTLWPGIHSRVSEVILSKLVGVTGSTKSVKGNWPGWHSWLLHRQMIPQFTCPCPLPFDKKCSFLELKKEQDVTVLHCSLARVPVPGKTKNASVVYHATIWDRGKSMRSRRDMLRNLIAGNGAKLASSQLFIKDGKLFASLAYKKPKPSLAVGEVAAVLRPGSKSPFRMRVSGRSFRVGGDGRVVATVRRQLMAQRWSRQHTYRQSASSSRKGHGLNRAMEKVTLLSNRWRDFVRTCNRNWAVDVCRRAVASGVGLIVFCPSDAESRFLSKAGRFDSRDRSRWDWYAFQKILQDKAVEFGLTVEIVKSSDSEDVAVSNVEAIAV